MMERLNYYLKRFGILVITVAIAAGTAGCFSSPSQDLEIRTWYDLNAIRNNLSGHHVLMNDLDYTTDGYGELAGPTANGGEGWHPIIGSGGDPPFTGTFEGQGYEIRDLFINLPGKGYVGLFSIVGEGGHIENVGLVNADVTGTAYTGGLVGSNLGTVSNCYSTGSLDGAQWVGGLVGFSFEEGTVSNSYSTGDVTSDYGAGGLLGGNIGNVNNSYATGSVACEEGAGGLVGANSGTVSNSYSTGGVAANDDVGGLVGYSEGTVSNSFWDIQTSGQSSSAGGTGKTTAQMQDIATFSDASWNIIAVGGSGDRNPSYIWNIVTGVSYPFLSWQP
jgi:hypothetical protein